MAALVGLAWMSRAVEPFERYRVILARAPFGAIVAPTQTVTAVNNLRLSALVSMPDGPRAGFVDAQGKNGFFLRLNERSESQVELLAVDYARERVTVRHDGQLLLIGLQPGDITVVNAAQAAMGFGPAPSALSPGAPPLPQHLSPELRMILTPQPPPDPGTPEGRRFHAQLQQLINPAPPPDPSTIALPMPGGLVQPQIQQAEPEQPTMQDTPYAPRRGNRHGGFGG